MTWSVGLFNSKLTAEALDRSMTYEILESQGDGQVLRGPYQKTQEQTASGSSYREQLSCTDWTEMRGGVFGRGSGLACLAGRQGGRIF